MRRLSKCSCVVAVALSAAACSGGSGKKSFCQVDAVLPGGDASSVPADHLAFTNWMLTLPVDADGGTAGQADTIPAAELTAGYESEWFYASDDGGVAFWAPVNGARTPTSLYPRSELREVLDPADPSVNWLSSDTAEMTASLAVSQVPAGNGKVIVGKVVGYNGVDPDVSYLVHLVYHLHGDTCRGSLYGLVEESPQAGGASAQRLTLIEDGIRLNEVFSYTIRVASGVLTLSSGAKSVSTPIAAAWDGVGLYFRAGAGLNTTGASANDGGSATFYDLVVTH